MKKIKIVAIMLLTLLAVSCSNLNSNIDGKVKLSDGIAYLGDVNKIYSAPSRFATGQIIEGFFGHTVRFEGNLVEYNIIKPEILEYVESLNSNNALMHQNYENVVYNPTKKYVEFSSYTDTTSGKVVRFEIRVFFGNFLETYQTDYWYAKSVMFNSSFTKDMDNNVAVNFGDPLGPVEDDEETSESNLFGIPQNVPDKIDNNLINAIGTPAKIYSATNTARFCTGQILTWGEDTVRFQGNLVAYSSVNQKVLSIFKNISLNALCNQGYSNVSYDSTKTYIEVCYYENVETGDIVNYEIRLVDGSYFTKPFDGNWYAKAYDFKSLDAVK